MKLLSFIILSLLSLPLFAQNNMNDYMRQTGKIYVVFGVKSHSNCACGIVGNTSSLTLIFELPCTLVILIIFIGIVIFLIRLERKIKKLENKINHE